MPTKRLATSASNRNASPMRKDKANRVQEKPRSESILPIRASAADPRTPAGSLTVLPRNIRIAPAPGVRGQMLCGAARIALQQR